MAEETPKLESEISEQQWLFRAVERAIWTRQANTDGYKDAVAGEITSLYLKEMRDELVKMLDNDIPQLDADEIRDFNKDGLETTYDIFDAVESVFDGREKERKIKAGEVIHRKIQDIMRKFGVIKAETERETTHFRERSDSER